MRCPRPTGRSSTTPRASPGCARRGSTCRTSSAPERHTRAVPPCGGDIAARCVLRGHLTSARAAWRRCAAGLLPLDGGLLRGSEPLLRHDGRRRLAPRLRGAPLGRRARADVRRRQRRPRGARRLRAEGDVHGMLEHAPLACCARVHPADPCTLVGDVRKAVAEFVPPLAAAELVPGVPVQVQSPPSPAFSDLLPPSPTFPHLL